MALVSAGTLGLIVSAVLGAATQYDVRITVDVERRQIYGREEIRIEHNPGAVEWQKQAGLAVLSAASSSADLTPSATGVRADIRSSGTHRMKFEYTATEGRGLRWLPNGAGMFTAFYCEAWMICSNAPDQRASLRLEIVIPHGTQSAAGPGTLRKTWRDRQGRHFLFEQSDPVQTYLFSFGVANMVASTRGNLRIHSGTLGHAAAFQRTADAATFMRERAGVDAIGGGYSQAFLPAPGLAQEAARFALMSEAYLTKLEQDDDVVLMAHELAHQWWGVLVGIRSWSDFWLNEGMAQFMSFVYLEKIHGHAAYLQRIEGVRSELDAIRSKGSDRPLHFEGWTDVRDALGTLPYVKGTLFLDRLRTELGDDVFWRGIALYTTRHAGRLVDSHDFQRALEEASRRNLSIQFEEVFGK